VNEESSDAASRIVAAKMNPRKAVRVSDALAENDRLRALLGGYRVPDRCHGCGEVRERGEPCGQCTCASVGVCGPGNRIADCAVHGEWSGVGGLALLGRHGGGDAV
jgi:hypothetical protein